MMPEDLNEDQTLEAEPEAAEAEDIETLKQALAEEKKKAEANLAGWQRAQADFINYKRRAEQEKEDVCKFANAELLCCILPILDDLERAFAAIPSQSDKADWVDGIRLIERKLRTSLEAQGISQIKALGKPFDPNLHEAVREDKGEEGIVIEEVERGYRLHDRVIRPSKVVVGNGKEERKEE